MSTLQRRRRPAYAAKWERSGDRHFWVIINGMPIACGYARTVPGAARRARRNMAGYLGVSPRRIKISLKRAQHNPQPQEGGRRGLVREHA